MTPNGAAANLAIGGARPVPTLSGKIAAFVSTRPAASLSPDGRAMVKAAFSASGVGNATSLTSSARSSLSNTGASAAPAAGCKRTSEAWARAIGAENFSVKGRIGKHGAFAFSRSQVNSAVKAARTV